MARYSGRGHSRRRPRHGTSETERLWRTRDRIAPDEQDWDDEDQDDDEEDESA